MKFSTNDRDNDLVSGNCAVNLETGWWFKKCHLSNLNGAYNSTEEDSKGIKWYRRKNDWRIMKKVEMRIRPAGF